MQRLDTFFDLGVMDVEEQTQLSSVVEVSKWNSFFKEDQDQRNGVFDLVNLIPWTANFDKLFGWHRSGSLLLSQNGLSISSRIFSFFRCSAT